MKPNRRDSQVQVPPPRTVNSSTSTTKAAAAYTSKTTSLPFEELKSIDDDHHNLLCNVSLIGWMGVIASLTVMLCTTLTMQCSNDVLRLVLSAFRKTTDMEYSRLFLRRVWIMVSTMCYSISALNVIMNILLLMGVRRRSHALLMPWLLFHGFLFGLSVHMSMYMTISGLLVDFKIFVILVATFTMALVIFFKVSFEVFILYKTLRREKLVHRETANAQVNTDGYVTLLSSTEV